MKRKLFFSLVFFLAMAELLLRWATPKLPPSVGNELHRTYTTSTGGIYVFDPVARINFCLPNFHKDALCNGYRWNHDTDARGFRNPPGTGSEVLLFGDSFIYGHGVEQDQTVAAFLRREHGWKVYNLARQGDGLSQQYIVFRLFYEELKPRKIILFPLVNDFGDIAAMHSDEQLKDPPELTMDYEALRRRLSSGELTQVGGWIERFYLYRLYDFWRRYQRVTGPPPKTRFTEAVLDPSLRAKISDYYEKLLLDMMRRCQEKGIEFEVIYMVVDVPNNPRWTESERILDKHLEQLCRRNHVKYRTTRELFHGRPEMTLPVDSHLSPAGHKALADWLAQDSAR